MSSAALAIFSYVLFGSSLIEKIPCRARRDDVVLSVGHFDFTSFKRIMRNSKDGCRCSYRRDRSDRSDELSRGVFAVLF